MITDKDTLSKVMIGLGSYNKGMHPCWGLPCELCPVKELSDAYATKGRLGSTDCTAQHDIAASLLREGVVVYNAAEVMRVR
jgi:hypothetical protein